METIFTAAMKSGLPQAKRAVAEMCIKAACKNQLTNSSHKMMECALELILNSEDDLVVQLSWRVFDAWSHDNDHFESFFTISRVSYLLQKTFLNPVNAVDMLEKVIMRLKKIKDCADLCSTVVRNAAGFVERNPKYDALLKFCIFLQEFPKCMPSNDRLSSFCSSLIKGISRMKRLGKTSDLTNYIVAVPKVLGGMLDRIWQGDPSICGICLETVFELISAPSSSDGTCEEERVSLALGAVVQFLPSDLMESSICQVTSDSFTSDAIFLNVLRHMINWLAWPYIRKLSEWTVFFLKCLESAGRYEVLDRITCETIPQIAERLQLENLRMNNFQLLEYMLQGCQHSDIPFHKLMSSVCAIYSTIRKEQTEKSVIFLDIFSDLILCLIQYHGRHQDLYKPVLDLIGTKTLKPDSFEKFKALAWKVQLNPIKKFNLQGLVTLKTFREKTGLQNHHNTCYLNSVIQTLYMCDSFREQLLTNEFSAAAEILNGLQKLLAFLKFSQRSSIDCNEFGRKATPAYFVWGHQQDASEFINHLIDSLMEQERRLLDGKFVVGSFYGRQICTSRCLTCKNEFSKVFSYAELSLHFSHAKTYKRALSFMGGGKHLTSGDTEKDGKAENIDCLSLEDMLSHYFETEQLEGECKYNCEHCGNDQDGEKFITLIDTPDFLRITLNRFTYNDLVSCKIMTEVRIPRTLVLPVQRESSEVLDVYCIVAVIVHCGRNTNCGHYYCIARHQKLCSEMSPVEINKFTLNKDTDFFVDEWFKFDDETISAASFDKISNCNGRTPYILVYKKINSHHNSDIDGNCAGRNIPQRLLELVEKDNDKYYKEISAKMEDLTKQCSSSNSWKDDDDDHSPRPSSNFDVGPRMVF